METRVRLWKVAQKKCNVTVAKKGTPAHTQVMKVFNELLDEEKPIRKMWKRACEMEGVQFVSKTNVAVYERVKKRFEWMKTRAGEMKDPFDFSSYAA